MKAPRRVAAAALAAALLAGCMATAGEDSPGDRSPAPSGDISGIAFGPAAEPGAGGAEALLLGELARPGGCTVIVGPDHVWLPVFPAGSVAWNGDVLTLEGVQANAASAELGASVELTGGEGSIASSNVTVPPECEGVYDGVWHVTGT